jgi:hypothetical protein
MYPCEAVEVIEVVVDAALDAGLLQPAQATTVIPPVVLASSVVVDVEVDRDGRTPPLAPSEATEEPGLVEQRVEAGERGDGAAGPQLLGQGGREAGHDPARWWRVRADRPDKAVHRRGIDSTVGNTGRWVDGSQQQGDRDDVLTLVMHEEHGLSALASLRERVGRRDDGRRRGRADRGRRSTHPVGRCRWRSGSSRRSRPAGQPSGWFSDSPREVLAGPPSPAECTASGHFIVQGRSLSALA